MSFKRSVFIFAILILSLSCYTFMNKDYDPLARYPYELTDAQHALIVDKLSQKEIEYLIDYAIAPVYYIDYLSYDGFNVYAIDEYNKMYDLYNGVETKEMVMRLVNCTRDKYTEDEVKVLLDNYYFYEIVDFYEAGNTELLATDLTAWNFEIPEDRTIGYYQPKDLATIDISGLTSTDIQLRQEAADALKNLYQAVKKSYTRGYKYLQVTNGFLSYDQLSNLYRQTNNDLYIPGHSVYQLGVQLDFTLTNVDETAYSTSSIAVWLSENAYQYGFIQVDQDQGFANHYRYVGVDLANLLFTQKLTLADYNNE